jgi:hypothetical protein
MITIKEITPYLPYYPTTAAFPLLYAKYGYVKSTLSIDKSHQFKLLESGSLKLVLRPITDLTKEIEINGGKFIPTDEVLTELHRECADIHFEWIDAVLNDKANVDNYIKNCPFNMIQIFISWHFDVFNLIKRGDAININTLNL